jgi:hypothetical protein
MARDTKTVLRADLSGLAIFRCNDMAIVSETLGERLTAFEIAADGTLGNRRVWAHLAGMTPDGISLDAEGAVCRSLYIATSYPLPSLFALRSLPSPPPQRSHGPGGRVEGIDVRIPGAGFP